MKIKKFQFNPVEENTYIAYDNTKECVIIDPGCFYPQERTALTQFVSENNLTVKHIINTHLHFDHIFGNHFVEKEYGLTTKAHQGDEFLVSNLATQLKLFGFGNHESVPPKIDPYLEENDTIDFGNQQFVVIHVPGHSPGSLVYYNAKAGCMFVGDVLFEGSIGRTDLDGGDHKLLIDGIKGKLLTLPSNTIVYSGHGPSTTVEFESKNNPFLQ